MKTLEILRKNWPEYIMEAALLGLFMISAGGFATLLFAPESPLYNGTESRFPRRILMGAAMGLTLIGLVYSPWGKQSGAHMNPALTLTYWRLGKVSGVDAICYPLAQCLGAFLGVIFIGGLLGCPFL